MRLPHGSIAVPCTPFSDGAVKSKYRNPGFGHSEAPAIRHEPIYLLLFSVPQCLRGALLLLNGEENKFQILNLKFKIFCFRSKS